MAQVWVLAIRNCRMYIRNPELLGAKLVTYICMGAFMGAPLRPCLPKHQPPLDAPDRTNQLL